MIILTNLLTEIVDEGGAKVVNSLIKRLKAADAGVTVVSCAETTSACDVLIPSNKLLLNPRLIRYLWCSGQEVVYMPAYARSPFSSVRTFLLSLFTRRRLKVLLYMHSPIGWLAKAFFRMSGARLIALSEDSYQDFCDVMGPKAMYLRTGVDTERFSPITKEEKARLRQKYHLPQDKTIVLHVGHLTEGRNIRRMTELDDRFHGVLVVSTTDETEEDRALRAAMEACPNLTLIDSYLPAVEEIYQLADVYLFPVQQQRNCIDVPVSVLEAAACGVPVVATTYGEMKALHGKAGFYRIEQWDKAALNDLLARAVLENVSPREHVLPYDWRHAVKTLLTGA